MLPNKKVPNYECQKDAEDMHVFQQWCQFRTTINLKTLVKGSCPLSVIKLPNLGRQFESLNIEIASKASSGMKSLVTEILIKLLAHHWIFNDLREMRCGRHWENINLWQFPLLSCFREVRCHNYITIWYFALTQQHLHL